MNNLITYEGKFNKQSHIQDDKVKLVGLLLSLMFIVIAVVFIIIDRPILIYISVFSLIICLIVFIYFIPKQIDERFKKLAKVKPFLNIHEEDGITHGDVTIPWDKIKKVAVIGQTDSEVNGFSTNSSNHVGNKVIILLSSDLCDTVLESNSSPMFKNNSDVSLMDIDLLYVMNPVDMIERLSAIVMDKNHVDLMYTDNVNAAEKFFENN